MVGALPCKTLSGTLTGIFVREKDIKSSKEGFAVSGSLRYSSMSSAMFSFTSFSVFSLVAISKVGQEATNHFPSFLIRIGKGIFSHIIVRIVFFVLYGFYHPKRAKILPQKAQSESHNFSPCKVAN